MNISNVCLGTFFYVVICCTLNNCHYYYFSAIGAAFKINWALFSRWSFDFVHSQSEGFGHGMQTALSHPWHIYMWH